MTPERWQQAAEAFEAALELKGDERSAFLAQLSSNDPALRSEVEALLAEDALQAQTPPSPIVGATLAGGYPSNSRHFEMAGRTMSLAGGAKLGPYEILSGIGAGGMGEVYKARDTRLNRTVAIKVLPSHFCDDPERKARFAREAQTIAGFNHPHICVLHDVGHQDGIDYLVMEYLEGKTLAQRLEKGALPLAEALKIAIEIADALDKAHRQGVVHRDLKPSNVMLTKSGTKLLDFGLAKLRQQTQPLGTLSTLPANEDVTTEGIILGTLQYMSPEQLEGQKADARSDIFAFGAVLYEMLTGRKAFQGRSQSSVIAAIMHTDPPAISALQPMTPAALDWIVNVCLAKDPDQRWQTVHDLALQLTRIGEDRSQAVASVRTRPSRLWSVLTAVFLLTAIALAALLILNYQTPREPQSLRFQIPSPDKTIFGSALAGTGGIISGNAGRISPDGLQIAFTARDEAGKVMLWVRPWDATAPRPLPGTEGAGLPFWSPDSRSIGFFTDSKLKTIDVAGRQPLTLCGVANARGGAWSKDGVIVFANQEATSLLRVPAVGGEPAPVTKEADHRTIPQFPSFLPDGKHFLFLDVSSGGLATYVTYIGSLDSPEQRRLLVADSAAIYSPPGYLLFVRQGTLMAQAFDPKKLELTGNAGPIAEQVASDGPGAGFSVSDSGTLTYRTGLPLPSRYQLVWVDRSGKALGSLGAPALYLGPALSPDGKRIAVHRHDGSGGDIWIIEAAGGKTSRLTFDASQENSQPIWSADGSSIVFGSRRNGKWGIYQKLSNSTGSEKLLFESDSVKMPMSWSAAANTILFYVNDAKTASDVWALPISGPREAQARQAEAINNASATARGGQEITGDRIPFPLLQTTFSEQHPQISPNGKWFAYTSNETGRAEIYVQSYPPGRGKWQISTNGGVWARWRPDGKELFYMERGGLGTLMAVTIAAGSTFEFSAPRPLFDSAYLNNAPGHTGNWNTFDVSSDGQRFLLARPEAANIAGTLANTPITVVANWTAALKKK